MPVGKLENGSWPHPARLPLGCGWTGHCTAPGHEGSVPAPAVLEGCCNLGYASSCSWSPPDSAWDAVRFAIVGPAKALSSDNKTAEENGRAHILRVKYVYERANRPAGQGELEFDLSTSSWLCASEDPRVQKMAECFVESYLNKRV